MRKKLIAALAIVAISLGAAAALLQRAAAPEVHFATLSGERLATPSLRGKVLLLVNFWATSCASCVKEMPMMAATYAIARGFGDVRVTPSSFLIDKQGRILKRYVGEPDWADFYSLVEKALSDPA